MNRPVRILIAEDNDIQRLALLKMLREGSWPCVLQAASDAQKALELCREQTFDILITDICMPMMDGTELAERVHAEHPETQIAFLTAYPSFEYAQKAISLHVFEYVLKPVDRQQLAAVVGRMIQALEQNSLSRECRQYALEHILWAMLDGKEMGEEACLLRNHLNTQAYRLFLLDSDSPFFYSRQQFCIEALQAEEAQLFAISLNERQLAILTADREKAVSAIQRLAIEEQLRVALSEPFSQLSQLGTWRCALDNELCYPPNQGKSFLEAHVSFTAPSDKKTSSPVRRALNYIDQHYAKPISLAELADTLNLSYSYLCSIFRKETGCTYVQYVTGLRIKVAQRLLETTSLRISEIARQVGYANAAYFAALFRNATGISPSEWRERK